jgi:hypothetical protein
MDLDTFFTTVYVVVDDWYKATMQTQMRRHWTGREQMSDSEVLTLALVGQWRVGVPWQSERGLIRYINAHGRQWFPTLLQVSAYNRRVRYLWAALVKLQQTLAQWLDSDNSPYEVVDCVPLTAYSLSQAHRRGHWLWWSHKGHGGTRGGWYIGDKVIMSSSSSGAITGWLIGDAAINDRWMLQALVSQRVGDLCLDTPVHPAHSGPHARVHPPAMPPVPRLAAGHKPACPYLADKGFNGARWHTHYRQSDAQVLTVPPANAPDAWKPKTQRWLTHHRQVIETVFASLSEVFSWQKLRAHSREGQITRVAAICAAHNFGLWLNRQLGRPLKSQGRVILKTVRHTKPLRFVSRRPLPASRAGGDCC